MSDTPNQTQKNLLQRLFPKRHAPLWRATFMHTLEFFALILALVFAISGGLAWRLAQGPVSLEFLRQDAQAALVDVFEGGTATIGTLQANWSPQERTIVFAARDVQVLGEDGGVLVQVPEFNVGLTALGLLQGKALIRRIVAIGGEFSFVRKADGRIGAGLGQPDKIAFNRSSNRKKQDADTKTGLASLPNVLNRLRVLEMRDATLRFVDERSGVDWVAPHADIRFVRDGNVLNASASGKIESASGTAMVSIEASSRDDFSRMSAELTINNAVPATLLPQSGGAWTWLSGLDAPLSAQISFSTTDEGLLKAADGHLRLASGVYRRGDRALPLDSAEVVFAFDPIDGAVSVQLAELQSGLISGSLKGRIAGLDPARLAVGEQVGFDLAFEDIRYNPGDVLVAPLDINSLWLNGYYIPALKQAEFKSLDISIFDLSLHGTGALYLPGDGRGENDPFLSLNARSEGQITPTQILALWPVKFAFGGRDWIRRNVLKGRIHDIVLDAQLPQRALQAPRLDNDMLTVSFAFDEAVSHFVHSMTPLRNGEGTGVLRGNRFDLRMDSARLLNMELTKGFVDIPRLSPKGVVAHFGGHAVGPLGDVVKLLDEEPLEFVSKYGLSPDVINGQGEIDFSISRAMRVFVPPKNIDFTATGMFEDIRVTGLVSGQDLSKATATFNATPKGLVVKGEGRLGPVPGDFIWHEIFFPQDEPRTQLEINVVTNEQVFDDLGIPTRLFVDGPMGIHMKTVGEGLNIQSATLEADLTAARLMSPGGDWEKPTGQSGNAGLVIQRRGDGGYDIKDFKAITDGFLLNGDLSIAAKGGVQSAHISRASMAGLFDFTADIERSDAGAFVLSGHAQSLDARGFVRGLTQGASTNLGFALDAHITFERALVSDAMTLQDGKVDFKRGLQEVETLDFSAKTPSGTAAFSIAPDPDGHRQLKGRADDAGLVIEALFGADSVNGGVLQIDGVLGDEEGHNTRLDLTMDDFKLGNVPVMARMLSLGSLTGIANTMSGEGIGFRKLMAPLEFENGTLKIGASRATGPALGVTVTGTVDLVKKTMALNGALAPAYSINSALGNIPILGGVLVSRKGEGVLGLSYKIQGPFEALQVFVNPLSALTPGVFRRIFEGGKPKVSPSPEASPHAPTEKPKSSDVVTPTPEETSDGGEH